MKIKEFNGKRILIVGKGVEGIAVFNFFKKHLPENKIVIIDKKDGANYLDKQKEFDIAIKSPGVKAEILKIPYTTATNIFLSNAKGKVIGVTGTKGKSTTSTLIYEMLKKQGLDVYFGGNIGQSSLEFLDKLNEQSWTVLEMSSFQLKDAKISPHIAVVLMVAVEHLDYHKDEKDYVDSKRNILKFQKKSDFAILNRDYIASWESDIHTGAKVFYISREQETDNGCFVKDGEIRTKVKDQSRSDRDQISKIINTKDIFLPGRYNLENVCAAVMAASLAGVSKENIVKVLKTFKGLEHRLEFVAEKGGIKFYNDSLSTIPEATIAALETFEDVETLIAGGFDRGIDFSELGSKIAKSGINTLILFPKTGEKIWEAIEKAGGKKNLEKFDVTSMEQAVRIAFAETTPGKICLLSPASASFGLFKDYKDRGEQFKKEVSKLK